MADTAQVLIQIRGDVGDINAKLADLRGNIGKVAAETGTLSKGMGSAFAALKGVAAALGAGLSVTALAGIVNQAAEAGDAMMKMAEKTGMSVESLSALKYAAALSDVEMEKVQSGVGKLARAMYDAAAGVETTQAVFKTLGVAYQDADGKLRDMGEIMVAIGARFAAMEDGATKAALAQKLFGKSGAELIPLLNNLQELADEARRVGYIMTQEKAESLEAYNDALKRIHLSSEALKKEFAAGLAPALTDIANAFLEAREEGWNFDDLIEAVGEDLKTLAMGVFDFIGMLKMLKTVTTEGWAAGAELDKRLLEQRAAFERALFGRNQAPPKDREQRGGFTPPVVPEDSKAALAQWQKMLIDMQADVDRLGIGVSDWDRKLVEVNRRYDESIEKLIAMKMHDAEHVRIIEDYRARVIALLAEERDWAALNRRRLDDMRAEAAEAENHLALNKAKLGVEQLLAAARLSLMESRGRDVDIQRLELEHSAKEREIRLEIEKIADDMTRAEGEARDALLAKKTALEMQLPILREILEIHIRIKQEAETVRTDPYAGMLKGLQDVQYAAESLGQAMEKTVVDAFGRMEDALVDFVKTGKLNFSNLVDSILADLARLLIRQTITGPLAAGLGAALGGGLSSLFGAGGAVSGTYGLDMAGGDFAGLNSATFHAGGVVGREGGRRSVRIGVNPDALPRYHTGIGPGEQLAVLQKGEAVFTPGQLRALGAAIRGGDTTINVPVNVEGGGRRLAAELRRNIEREVQRTLKGWM